MLHSFPRRQQRGLSMNSTRGFGFTVKWRNRLTTSRSVRIPDWAGPAEEHKSSDAISRQKREGIFLGFTWGGKLDLQLRVGQTHIARGILLVRQEVKSQTETCCLPFICTPIMGRRASVQSTYVKRRLSAQVCRAKMHLANRTGLKT